MKGKNSEYIEGAISAWPGNFRVFGLVIENRANVKDAKITRLYA